MGVVTPKSNRQEFYSNSMKKLNADEHFPDILKINLIKAMRSLSMESDSLIRLSALCIFLIKLFNICLN